MSRLNFGIGGWAALRKSSRASRDFLTRLLTRYFQLHQKDLHAISDGKFCLTIAIMTPVEAAAAAPVGSEIFFVVSLLIISAGVLLLERYYLPLRTTPAYLLVPIFFALGLPASIILLVPIDLASSSGDHDVDGRGIWLPRRLLLVSWRISYWLTFALTWYVCPRGT